ncbi:MAG TPA: cell division protein FtsA [Candidatus Kapabacteria bacterium]|nr:cell division protein FtsA [Candidatus Kapabacteria bacterium]
MFDRSSTIVGLDIGTSKICAVVGEINETGALTIVGLGQAKSRGVRKGEIVDFNLAQEDIRNAIVEAEQMADVEIRSVYLGVTGPHIRGFNNRGFHPVASHDREIVQEDVEDAIKNAKTINLPAENRIIHVVRQHFLVDGQEGVLNPVGMFGARVEVDVHVVHGLYNRLQNPIKAVKALQLEVEDIVFNGIATALAVLNTQQKELGALIIDIGSGVTEYAVYTRGVIKHTGVLAVGGDHVSNDLAYGLKIPLGRAEQLKIDYGSAVLDDRARGQSIALSNDLGIHERNISLEHLRRIMSARLEEIFEIIAQELEEAGVLSQVREGVFLAGGCSRTPEIQRLASRIFGLPVCVANTSSISGLKSALDQPEFATGIGLARYGSFEWKKRTGQKGSLAGGIKSTLGKVFRLAGASSQ